MSSSGDTNLSNEGNQTSDVSQVCCYYFSKFTIKILILKLFCFVL